MTQTTQVEVRRIYNYCDVYEAQGDLPYKLTVRTQFFKHIF